MATTYGFHAHDGWWFNRADDGTVQVVQTDPTNSDRVLQTVMFDATTWASIVASISKAAKPQRGINPSYPPPGEDATLDLMRSMGLPDPGTPEAEDWVDNNILR